MALTQLLIGALQRRYVMKIDRYLARIDGFYCIANASNEFSSHAADPSMVRLESEREEQTDSSKNKRGMYLPARLNDHTSARNSSVAPRHDNPQESALRSHRYRSYRTPGRDWPVLIDWTSSTSINCSM